MPQGAKDQSMPRKPTRSNAEAGGNGLLVEREREVERLERSLRQARAGAGSLVWIEGGPGTGRSSLLAAAASRAERARMLVLRGSGRESERLLAFGVTAQAFEPHLKDLDAAGRGGLPGGPGSEAEGVVEFPRPRSPEEQFDLIQELFRLTRRLAEASGRGGSLALLVDDVERADAESLRFLAYLAARIQALPVALLVASAPAGVSPGDPLLAGLREAAAEVLRLADLSVDGVTRLVRAQPSPADRSLAQACFQASGGNPFLLSALLEEGRRAEPDPGRSASTWVEELMPESVLARVRGRLAGLPPQATTLAATVLALGGKTPLAAAAAVAPLELEAAAEAAEMLIERGLLAPRTPLSFPSPLIASAVERAVGGVRRELLRERAAACTPAAPALSPAERAEALVSVDDLERALRILAAPRRRAREAGEPEAQLAEACWRAWSLYHQGLIGRALSAAESAVEAAGGFAAPEPALSGAMAAARLQLGQVDRAAAALRILDEPASLPARGLAVLLDVRAQLRLVQNRPTDALVDALEAGRRSDGSSPGIVAWRSTAALARLALDEPGEARRLAEEELELARAGGATRVIVRCLRALGLAEGAGGLDLLSQAVATGAGGPLRLEYLSALIDLGAAMRRANRRLAAQEPLRRALELSRQRGAIMLARRARVELAVASGRNRGSQGTGLEALTTSERRVALLAADGRTTRQIAGELFVTPKAVEFHLRHIYRKLGIPSTRVELARAVQAEGSGAAGD